jgi:threonine/homoserine/homoserine lactone efflux protein
MLTAAGANGGVVRGLPCLVGVTAGMGLMMFVVPLGLGSLILRNALVLKALNWAGAAFLLWLSWKIATSRRMDSLPESRPVGFIGAAVFQWVNPKSWLVTASAAGAFLHTGAGSPVLQSALLGGLFVPDARPILFIASPPTAQRLLQTPRRLRAFNITMGILLALSIGLILW